MKTILLLLGFLFRRLVDFCNAAAVILSLFRLEVTCTFETKFHLSLLMGNSADIYLCFNLRSISALFSKNINRSKHFHHLSLQFFYYKNLNDTK